MRHVFGGGAICVAWREGELDAVVGQHRVDLVWHGGDQGDQEGRSRGPASSGDGLDEGELAGPVDCYIQIELALGGSDLGDVDVEVADRVALELAPGRFVALDLGQAADAVSLKAAVQGGAGQMRDRGLQRVEAVVQRQQRVSPKGDDHSLFFNRKGCRSWVLWNRGQIGGRGPLLPFGDGLLVDPVTPGEHP